MRQMGLFATAERPTVLVAERGDVTYVPEFLDGSTADTLLAEMRTETHFRADSRIMYGKRVLVPRETAGRGEGMAQAWTPLLLAVRARIEAHTRTSYDYVFVNRYRSGNDSVAWHGDNDGEEDARKVVASLSLGVTRTFELRPKKATALRYARIGVAVAHGDLVVMQGDTHLHWEHRVPKEPRIVGERINLTFRQHRAR